MSIRAVIVDDEPFARERLRELCALEPDIAIVGEAAHGAEALLQVQNAQPDLLLLDVQMRGINGFGVLKQLRGARPLVVFVSAHEQYALEAFDVEAVDYLLKPFDRERFRQAIRRVRARLAGARPDAPCAPPRPVAQIAAASPATPSPAAAAPPAQRRIVAERDGRLVFIAQADIDSIEADRNYVHIRAGEERYTIRWTMQQAQAALDPTTFLRVHRSVIINTLRIREMERWFHGEYIITLANGQRFTSGRAYRQQIQAHLRNVR